MLRATCSVCGKVVKGGDDWAGRSAQCPNCQAPIYFPAVDVPPSPAQEPEPSLYESAVLPDATAMPDYRPADRRRPTAAPSFKVLETLARCYEIMGIIAGAIACVFCIFQFALIALSRATAIVGLINIVVIAISGALTVLFCYAVAEHIRLMLQVERNTRDTAEILTDLVVMMQADK